MAPRHDAYLSQRDGKSLLALASIVGLTGSDPESRTTWIHVAPFGEWGGHSQGAFKLTREFFESVVRQLAGKRTPVSLDYEHASIRPTGGETPASGYALSAEIRGDGTGEFDGLYARVEFTVRAASLIRAGEYRFCSGVFQFDSEDAVSGKPIACALDTIALTNRPFIDGQKPIVLSREIPLTAGATSMVIDLKVLQKALDALPGENTAEKIKMVIDLLAKKDEAAPPEAPKVDASKPLPKTVPLTDAAPAVALADPAKAAPCADPPMPMADPPPAADADMDIDARLMAATGLDEAGLAAAFDANFDALVSLLLGNASTAALSRDLEVTTLRGKLDELTVEVNGHRADAAKRFELSVTAEVEAAIKDGKYLPGQKTVALSLARKDLKGFRELTATMQVNPLLKPHASAHDAPLGQSENTDGKLPKTHPKVIALATTLGQMRVNGVPLDPKIIEAKLAELTG